MSHSIPNGDEQVLPAPDVVGRLIRTAPAFPPPRPAGNGSLEAEYEALVRMWPDLLRSHHNQYVAICQGQVVESGPDKVLVAQRAYQKCGYVPIYVHLVTDQPQPLERLPSPRLAQGTVTT